MSVLVAPWSPELLPTLAAVQQPRFTGSAGRSHPNGQRHPSGHGPGWPLRKSLCDIPSLYSGSLAYGFNLLRGPDHPSPAGRWIIRNKIVWARPNPPVGSLGGRQIKDADGEVLGKEGGDRFRTATSVITVATRSDHAWSDLDGVRTAASGNTHKRVTDGTARTDLPSRHRDGNWSTLPEVNGNPDAGAPPLDFAVEDGADLDGWHLWVMSPAGYKGAHYAVYPTELPKRLIEMWCPRHVCTVCGEPRRRITETTGYVNARTGAVVPAESWPSTELLRQGAIGRDNGSLRQASTLGWTDCGHDAYTPGVVLDPFSGSGTTLAAATGLGRDAIGIDIDERNITLHEERVGMFLEVTP